MLVNQISVFIENNKGKLADVTKILADNNIDLTAISIADTENFGIIRMMANKPREAVKAMRNAGYAVDITEVIAVEVDNQPGGLHRVLDLLKREGVNIQYLYSFVRTKSEKTAYILFKVDEPKKAIEILIANDIKLLSQEDVDQL